MGVQIAAPTVLTRTHNFGGFAFWGGVSEAFCASQTGGSCSPLLYQKTFSELMRGFQVTARGGSFWYCSKTATTGFFLQFRLPVFKQSGPRLKLLKKSSSGKKTGRSSSQRWSLERLWVSSWVWRNFGFLNPAEKRVRGSSNCCVYARSKYEQGRKTDTNVYDPASIYAARSDPCCACTSSKALAARSTAVWVRRGDFHAAPLKPRGKPTEW